MLDRLERKVDVSNQTVKSFEAQYRNAVALVAEARAGLFPVVSVSSGVTRSGGGGSSGGGPALIHRGWGAVPAAARSAAARGTEYSLTGSVTWDLDVWGRIRREVESNVAGAQVSAADLANARLSAQATLATDYFDLRAEDALSKLLADTVTAYRRALEITQNQYHAGTTSSIDYVTALALLQSTEAQLIAVGVQRQQFEHAIAVLTGQPPADLTLPPASLATAVPVVPAGMPSALLERRPDIAAAERTMQQENALIGVQVAAFYPDISLSALGGFAGNPLGQLLNSSNQLWSLAASGTEVLFEGGLRSASVAAARATYDVIRGDLPADRADCVPAGGGSAVEPAHPGACRPRLKPSRWTSNSRAVRATLNAYVAGTVPYTSVVTEQTLLLSNEQTALAVQQSRLVASVALIEALGGGWSTADLPHQNKLEVFNPR